MSDDELMELFLERFGTGGFFELNRKLNDYDSNCAKISLLESIRAIDEKFEKVASEVIEIGLHTYEWITWDRCMQSKRDLLVNKQKELESLKSEKAALVAKLEGL